jgi:transposase
MPAAYSEDLRIRVLAEFDKKQLKISEIVSLFNIDQKTIYRWRKQRKDVGNISPKKNYQNGHSHKITDLESFQMFVVNHSDLTTKEMAIQWGNISATTIRRWLKKMNFTFKKNSSITKNATK